MSVVKPWWEARRVRERRSTIVPPAGMVFNLDSEIDLVDSAGEVTSWTEQVTTTALVPPSAPARPTLSSSANLNGVPTVLFADGSGEQLSANGTFGVEYSWTNATIVYVVDIVTLGNNHHVVDTINDTGNILEVQFANAHYAIFDGTALRSSGAGSPSDTIVTGGQAVQIELDATAGTVTWRRNGVYVNDETYDGTFGWANAGDSSVNLGSGPGADTFAGHMAWIGVWDRVLTADETVQLQSYLSSRYGL